MAQRTDVDRGRAIIERWCALAEQRLDYLTELLETGRWCRFHTEADFVENFREAKTAVQTWRMLASREATPGNRPIDLSWLGREATPLAQRDCVRNPRAVSAPPVAIVAASPPVQPSPVVAGDAAAPPLVVQPGWERGLDLAVMQERYPLLRNTL
jgi:hypothetical protein